MGVAGRDFAGTPSDDIPEVLDTGRADVTTVFVSLAARDPDGRDAEYIRWHSLDHSPEQHRLGGLRGSLRLVSTPGCRAVRAAGDDRYDAVDHVMTYWFADPATLGPFRALGRALREAGRMPLRLPSVQLAEYRLAGRVAAPRVVVGADVVPWRPAVGVYLLLEQGVADAARLIEAGGVAGVWWATRTENGAVTQLTHCFLDDDPVDVAGRLEPLLADRWRTGAVQPLLAAPFLSVVPHEWDRHLP
jgi:hypothetical protein